MFSGVLLKEPPRNGVGDYKHAFTQVVGQNLIKNSTSLGAWHQHHIFIKIVTIHAALTDALPVNPAGAALKEKTAVLATS